jgi:hypothetical protein
VNIAESINRERETFTQLTIGGMAYYQDQEDPYGSYAPPLDPYVTEEESFEFYDEGIDPYGEDGLYLSDGVEEEYADASTATSMKKNFTKNPCTKTTYYFKTIGFPFHPKKYLSKLSLSKNDQKTMVPNSTLVDYNIQIRQV